MYVYYTWKVYIIKESVRLIKINKVCIYYLMYVYYAKKV